MNKQKRAYNSENRQAQALQTRNRILMKAKDLFAKEGFEGVTIDELAQNANVSTPTVYALFGSKRGILRSLMDEALPPEQYQALIDEALSTHDPRKVLLMGAKIARLMYDAEKTQMDFLRGASVISPEFKDLEHEREERRYHRLEPAIKIIEKALKPGLKREKARDIFWAFTGRDMYRLFVIERRWSSDDYEAWLGEHMMKSILKPEALDS